MSSEQETNKSYLLAEETIATLEKLGLVKATIADIQKSELLVNMLNEFVLNYKGKNENDLAIRITQEDEIDRSLVIGQTHDKEINWDTSHLGASRDLLIGDGEDNILASGRW